MPDPAPDAEGAEFFPNDPRFPPTEWAAILAAFHQSSPGAEAALAELCRIYWYPLYAYLRRNGHSPEESEDLTQEFFAQRFVTGKIFHGATPDGGRFRTWLLNSLQNLVRNEIDKRNAQKRDGRVAHLSLDLKDAEGRYCAEPVDEITPEILFDRAWVSTLLEQTLETLRKRYEAVGKSEFFEAMRCYLPGALNPAPYAKTAMRLGKSEDAVKNAASRLREEFGITLTNEIKRIVSDPQQVQEELNHLLAIMGD
jgi:RNA polymerase sigma factor (sigma-70 family)